MKLSLCLCRPGPGGSSGDNKAEVAADESNDKEISEAAAAAAQEVPTKCVANVMKIQIKAQIQYIDFEGRADGECVSTLVTFTSGFILEAFLVVFRTFLQA